MNPKENEICVDNIRPENVRHLKFSLHFEDWTTQNDFRQGLLYIWTETLENDHFKEGCVTCSEPNQVWLCPLRSDKTVSRLARRKFSQKTNEQKLFFAFLLFTAKKPNSFIFWENLRRANLLTVF